MQKKTAEHGGKVGKCEERRKWVGYRDATTNIKSARN